MRHSNKLFALTLIAFLIASCAASAPKTTSQKFIGAKIDPAGTAQYLLTNPPIYFEFVGKGKPLLLLHSSYTSGIIFSNLVKELKASHQLIIPDLPGHGLSGGKHYSNQLAEEQILEILDSLGIKKTDILGISLGANLALSLVNKYPNRFGKVVLIQSIQPKSPTEHLFSLIPMMGVENHKSAMNKNISRHQNKEVKKQMEEAYRYARYPAIEDVSRELKPFQIPDYTKNITPEVLILIGKKEDLSNHHAANKLNEQLPHSNIRKLSKLYSTNLLYENAGQAAQSIREFLKDK